MQILSLKSVESTQNYLKELLRENRVRTPYAVVADIQTAGIGSRGNSWMGLEGNLFLSFAISINDLPSDLKIESSSIYFGYLLKETLTELGSKVWLKWPNDFYIEDKKIGGMITHAIKDTLVCGVGLNLKTSPSGFARLDRDISRDELLEHYFSKLQKLVSWKQVFSKYELEFNCNKNFFTHSQDKKISLNNVALQSDGSIISNGERIFSLR
ncbi:MAG: biotin--[acetyl-CoA-carboxylase] ligase [Sulfurimonadaceae bacterium]|nr:biotin--[acetyl-CoA-carboxylase] ligase [Sulfurimonadaceae bacterium]